VPQSTLAVLPALMLPPVALHILAAALLLWTVFRVPGAKVARRTNRAVPGVGDNVVKLLHDLFLKKAVVPFLEMICQEILLR
ncbi:unnamed protein product, partial [Symbiodinium sp. KB8]